MRQSIPRHVDKKSGVPKRSGGEGGWAVAHCGSLFTFMHWRRKWQPTPVFLPGESQGRGILVGCRLWGRTELDTTKTTYQQQQQQTDRPNSAAEVGAALVFSVSSLCDWSLSLQDRKGN